MYGVSYVGRDDLPAGHDWLMMRFDDGRTHLFIARDRVTPRVLCRAWAGFCELLQFRTRRALMRKSA